MSCQVSTYSSTEKIVVFLRGKLMGLLNLLMLGVALSVNLAQANLALTGAAGDPGGGQLRLHSPTQSAAVDVLAQRSEVDFNITANIATVTLTQQFHHSGSDWVDGEYLFPLPDNAIVKRLVVTVGERKIVGSIREKAQAKALYKKAQTSGRKAALVQQHRPNLFRTRIANIGPGEHVSVTLVYRQLANYDQGRFSLRFPMTITPRYQPAATHAPIVMANPITPVAGRLHNPVSIRGRLQAGVAVQRLFSPQYALTVSDDGVAHQFAVRAGDVEMDRDFELVWQPEAGAQPRATLLTEQRGEQHFALLMVLPPASGAEQVLEREVLFVIDVSGSMSGASIRQAKAALRRGLDGLTANDTFNVIAFNDSAEALFDQPMPASTPMVSKALRYVSGLDAGGGTEMSRALSLALKSTPSSHERLQQLVFITDGAVGNEQALFEMMDNGLGSRRLFTVGIGSAPNSWFMRKAAQVGRGRSVFIGDLNQVEQTMTTLLEAISRPLSRDMSVTWPAGVGTVQHPNPIPDLYAGQPLLAVAKLDKAIPDHATVSVSGELAGQRWELTTGESTAPVDSGLADLWARAQIDHLLDERRRGMDEETVRREVLGLSLTYQLLSPYTAFIAIAEEVERLPAQQTRNAVVRNTRPHGQTTPWPATATSAEVKLWFGMGLVLFALLTIALTREEPNCDVSK